MYVVREHIEQNNPLTGTILQAGDMKQCPKCKKMNSAYADTCKYCGYEIKWVPDDGTDYQPPPNFSAEESKFKDGGTTDEERYAPPNRASLDDIYDQLEDIKGQITTGVNIFDITMPFHRMVVLIIKLTFASIPAALIMAFISSVFWLLFGNLFIRAMLRSYGIH